MYPILLQFGPVIISSLWTLIAIGFFASLIVLHRLISKDRKKLTFIAEHSLVIFLSGLIAARVVFILRNLPYFLNGENENGVASVLFLWDKGLSPWGGIIGCCLVIGYFCWKEKENIFEWLDILVITILTSFVFGNIGTLLDGLNYGRETTMPWGVIIENSRFAVPIHPVQAYAAIYCAVLVFFLYRQYQTQWYKIEGKTGLTGIACYALLRFFEEFLRGNESNYILGLREAQIYCLLAFIASAGLWYIINKSKKSTPS